MKLHHFSIRTADIFRSIAFYEGLGFAVEERFTAGITLACWMRGPWGRLELMQVPQPHPAPDPFGDPHYVGYYHPAFEVGPEWGSLANYLEHLRAQVPLTLLLPPQLQQIGGQVYEVAFITDPDGLPIELIRPQGSSGESLPQRPEDINYK
jgi:catechol 2,3-dioxygenase-like lactoylglutathione lyase family enzyme